MEWTGEGEERGRRGGGRGGGRGRKEEGREYIEGRRGEGGYTSWFNNGIFMMREFPKLCP